MSSKIAIGVDIGGSHISSAAVDTASGKLLPETISHLEVDNQEQAFRIISRWTECIASTIDKTSDNNITGLGFAMPGPFDYVNGIALFRGVPKYENLYGFNIADAMISSLDLPENMAVRFMNDATAFAVGESIAGATADRRKSVAITLGTGFGSAFIENNIPVASGNTVPEKGCLYHLPYAGGIADESFSTRWFLKRYQELTGEEVSGVKEMAFQASENRQVEELFIEFGANLGEFLAPWLNRFNAEVLVAGGNIAKAWSLFGDSLQASLKAKSCDTAAVPTQLGEESALTGSARLTDDQYWKSIEPLLPFM
jgi:glucokinase